MRFLTPVLAAAFFLGTSFAAEAPLQLHGSTTLKGVLEARKAELETQAGRPIEFNGSGTQAGLLSLASGHADVAMLSTPIEEVAKKLNDKTPGAIDVSQYQVTHVGEVKLTFVVNPRNPVRKLNATQLAAVLSGEVKNWKDVGGADAAIVVVNLANAGSLVQEKLLHGKTITPAARHVPNASQIPAVVAQEPNAIGIISAAHVKGQTSLIQTDAEIFAPLFLVTKGEPKAEARRLIESAKKLLAGSS
jgi:phosphate transport system substrate-binding protein